MLELQDGIDQFLADVADGWVVVHMNDGKPTHATGPFATREKAETWVRLLTTGRWEIIPLITPV